MNPRGTQNIHTGCFSLKITRIQTPTVSLAKDKASTTALLSCGLSDLRKPGMLNVLRLLENAVTTPELLEACREIIDASNATSARGCPSWSFILREVRKRGFSCSRPTLVNFLKDEGMIQRSFSKGLFLTEVHKAKRLTFALKMQKWSVAQLRHIIWCDEKKFTCQLGRESRSYICRASDPPKPPLKAAQKWFGGDGINVWMG